MDKNYDVVVVGGGAAGLNGALTLARARRSVLVVDEGRPRNALADGVHNYLGRDGTPPADLTAAGRAEVAGYGGTVIPGRVIAAHRPSDGEGFELTLDNGTQVTSRRLLVTTGLVDELPDVPGLAQRWGRDVLHCPYCHGWEVRDQAIGVLATGPAGPHQAELLRQWSPDVTLFLHTAPDLDREQWTRLAARGIAVVDGEVTAVEVADDRITGLRLHTGRVVPRQAVVVAPRFVARAELLTTLGLQTVEQKFGDHVLGTVVPADRTGATAVDGVWVAGNVADLQAGVINAAAAGYSAAVAINADLVADDVRLAMTGHARREGVDDRGVGATTAEPFSALVEAGVSERVLGVRRHGL
ncbi:NAD(P)/FAD-dependent oxidoreductase [Pseudonocardia sp. CA-142604]|uniref:NAD(P)/FAD-dependent oxidoreductase n=1 Tax=Pseudonocardia sp. CA-142604 TaxID=3240024 RepID=UPI003D94D918